MANKDDNIVEVEEYATVTEVDGIRRTLYQFMKQQELFNVKMTNTMDQLMELMMKTANSKDCNLPEDKGSSQKGNPIKPPDPICLPKPSMSNMQLRKSQVGPSGLANQKHFYTPPKLKAIAQGTYHTNDPHMGDQHHQYSTQAQFHTSGWDERAGDEYTSKQHEETFEQSGQNAMDNQNQMDILQIQLPETTVENSQPSRASSTTVPPDSQL